MDWSSHSETQEDPIQKNKPTFDKDETELVVCIDLKCQVQNKFIYNTKQYKDHNGHKIEEFVKIKTKILEEAKQPQFLYSLIDKNLTEAKSLISKLDEQRNNLKINLEEKQKTIYALEHCSFRAILDDKETQDKIIKLFISQREYYYFSKEIMNEFDQALEQLNQISSNLKMKYWWSAVDKHPDITLEGMIAHTDAQGYRYAYIEPLLQKGVSFKVNLRIKSGNVRGFNNNFGQYWGMGYANLNHKRTWWLPYQHNDYNYRKGLVEVLQSGNFFVDDVKLSTKEFQIKVGDELCLSYNAEINEISFINKSRGQQVINFEQQIWMQFSTQYHMNDKGQLQFYALVAEQECAIEMLD